jgi:16S rRNA (guanine527-N7)-methyltransferase
MDALVRRALAVGLTLHPATAARAWTYFELLGKWSARMNLTGLRVAPDNDEAIDRLLVEPMMAAVHAGAARAMVDVGSGGGSPAVPFALAAASAPGLTMVEARARKSVFLREALRETGLAGEVVTARFEEFAAKHTSAGMFDLATIRAVRLDEPLLIAVAAVLAQGGQLFCFHEQGGAPADPAPSLRWGVTRPLVPTLKSYLTIATKG